MIKNAKNFLLLIFVLIGVSGCFEFRIPDIGPIVPPSLEFGPYEFYITSQSIDFEDIIEMGGDQVSFLNDLREPYPGDTTGMADWFVYRADFSDTLSMPFDFSIDPVSTTINQSIAIIDFSTKNFNLSRPIEMQSIVDLSDVPDGTTITIDSEQIENDTSFVKLEMDHQSFSQGDIEVTINNNLECSLGAPIVMTFYDSLTSQVISSDNGNEIKLVWDSAITPGSSSKQSVSLVGVEFPKSVMIVTEAVACGSGPETLTVSPSMRTSSFIVSGSFQNLKCDQFEGQIDAQSIHNTQIIDLGEFLDAYEVSAERVYLDTAHISITLNNSSTVTGKVLLNLNNIDTSDATGVQFFSTDSITIPSEGSTTVNFTLNHASVDLTSDFEISSYIESPSQYASINLDDEYSVSFELYGATPTDPIRFKSLDATFTNMHQSIQESSIDLDLSEIIPEAFDVMELASVEIGLDIVSAIDVPMTLNLELVGVKNSGLDSTKLIVSQQITGPGGNSHIDIANAADLINFRPEQLFFKGSVILDGSGNLSLTQDIYIDAEIVVPVQFTLTDPLAFALPYIPIAKIDSLPNFLDNFTGGIRAKIDNKFRFGVNLNVYAAHDTSYFANTAMQDSIRTFAEFSVAAMDTSMQNLILTVEDYNFLVSAQDSTWLKMDVELLAREDGQPTSFISTDAVTVDLFIQVGGTLVLEEIFSDTTNGE